MNTVIETLAIELGLTPSRCQQMMKTYRNDADTVREIVAEWTPRLCNQGYDIFSFDATGMLEVEAIDDVGAFADDRFAVAAAIEDGIKIIPIDELPQTMPPDLRWHGWIDTPENRNRIAETCLRMSKERTDYFPVR